MRTNSAYSSPRSHSHLLIPPVALLDADQFYFKLKWLIDVVQQLPLAAIRLRLGQPPRGGPPQVGRDQNLALPADAHPLHAHLGTLGDGVGPACLHLWVAVLGGLSTYVGSRSIYKSLHVKTHRR